MTDSIKEKIRRLNKLMWKAVDEEDYERAAQLRDAKNTLLEGLGMKKDLRKTN